VQEWTDHVDQKCSLQRNEYVVRTTIRHNCDAIQQQLFAHLRQNSVSRRSIQ